MMEGHSSASVGGPEVVGPDAELCPDLERGNNGEALELEPLLPGLGVQGARQGAPAAGELLARSPSPSPCSRRASPEHGSPLGPSPQRQEAPAIDAGVVHRPMSYFESRALLQVTATLQDEVGEEMPVRAPPRSPKAEASRVPVAMRSPVATRSSEAVRSPEAACKVAAESQASPAAALTPSRGTRSWQTSPQKGSEAVRRSSPSTHATHEVSLSPLSPLSLSPEDTPLRQSPLKRRGTPPASPAEAVGLVVEAAGRSPPRLPDSGASAGSPVGRRLLLLRSPPEGSSASGPLAAEAAEEASDEASLVRGELFAQLEETSPNASAEGRGEREKAGHLLRAVAGRRRLTFACAEEACLEEEQSEAEATVEAKAKEAEDEEGLSQVLGSHQVMWPSLPTLGTEDYLSRASDLGMFWFFEKRDRANQALFSPELNQELPGRLPSGSWQGDYDGPVLASIQEMAEWPRWRLASLEFRDAVRFDKRHRRK